MRLTTYTDYTLRALMYLGEHPDRLVTVREIAEAQQISLHHLTKIVTRLSRAGVVSGMRGRNGGMCLVKPPERIRLGDIVRASESSLALAECFGHEPSRCVLASSCRLRDALADAAAAFLDALDRLTLADLITPSPPAGPVFATLVWQPVPRP